MVKIPKGNPEMINVDYAGKILGVEELEPLVDRVNKMAREDFYGAKVLDQDVEIDVNTRDLFYTPINGTILVGQVVREMFGGVGIATRAQKERAYENGLSWEGVYSYDSLCVGGVDFSGERLSGRELDFNVRLMKLLREREQYSGEDLQDLERLLRERPALVKIDDLSLVPDSGYGFRYEISPDAKVVLDKRLKSDGKFNEVDGNGLPNFCEDGKRNFYANQGRLQGVCVGGGGRLYANVVSWSRSDSRSRVVLTDSR